MKRCKKHRFTVRSINLRPRKPHRKIKKAVRKKFSSEGKIQKRWSFMVKEYLFWGKRPPLFECKLRGKNFYMRIYPILHKENSRNIVRRRVLSSILSLYSRLRNTCYPETLQEMSIFAFGYAYGNTRDTKQINTYGKSTKIKRRKKKTKWRKNFSFRRFALPKRSYVL